MTERFTTGLVFTAAGQTVTRPVLPSPSTYGPPPTMVVPPVYMPGPRVVEPSCTWEDGSIPCSSACRACCTYCSKRIVGALRSVLQ